jgi:hypothetical protein
MANFVVRLVEQVLVSGLAAGSLVLAATDDPFSKAAIVAAGVAAVRAAYGLVVKTFGDPNQPSAN